VTVRPSHRVLLAALVAFAAACDGSKEPAAPARPKGPDHVTVEHILIGVQGAPQIRSNRTPEEARRLAHRIAEMVKAEPDSWDDLRRRYSDDPGMGTYSMANDGVQPRVDEKRRDEMVRGFADVAFSLQVGEVGIAEFDLSRCPFGFHVIKRSK